MLNINPHLKLVSLSLPPFLCLCLHCFPLSLFCCLCLCLHFLPLSLSHSLVHALSVNQHFRSIFFFATFFIWISTGFILCMHGVYNWYPVEGASSRVVAAEHHSSHHIDLQGVCPVALLGTLALLLTFVVLNKHFQHFHPASSRCRLLVFII